MLIAAWLRWKDDRQVRGAALAAGLLALDLLIGPALIAWEINLLREMMR